MKALNRLDRVRRDLRQAIRGLTRVPGFTILAIGALALGIGATSIVYCIVDAVLLRPLPYPDPDRLVVLEDQLLHGNRDRNLATPAQYAAWSTAHNSLSGIGAFTDALYNASLGDGQVERVPVLVVSRSLALVLGIRLSQGRWLDNDNESAHRREVIVSDTLWRRKFGDARLDGQSLILGNERFTIVGVLTPGALLLGRPAEVLLPLPPAVEGQTPTSRRYRYLTVLGRLRPQASLEQARQELSVIALRLGQQYPDTDGERAVAVTPLSRVLLGNSGSAVLVLFAAVGSLLFIACANVSSLLLARSLSRSREVAIRLAIGAGYGDLFRQLLTEAAVLAGTGGAIGLITARILLPTVLTMAPQDLPRITTADVDARAVLFGLLSIVAAAIAVVIIPTCQLFRRDFPNTLREGGRSGDMGSQGTRTRGAMMSAQVALALVLSVGSGLLIKSLLHLGNMDPGFRPEGATAMEISLPGSYDHPEERIAFFRRLLDQVEALPSVEAAGLTNRLPLSGDNSSRLFNLGVASDPGRQHSVEMRRITPGFLRALGMHLIAGRPLTDNDTATTTGVALVNEAFARRFLPGQEPLGKQVFVVDGPRPRPWQIVGLVNDVRHDGLASEPRPEIYVSYYDRTWHNMTLVIRTRGAEQHLIASVRSALSSIDSSIPLANVTPLSALIAASTGQQRFQAFLLSSFTLLALALASVGIYGVTAYSVSRRTAEIGLRIALGARPRDIVWLISSWTMRLAGIGVAFGTLLSFGAAWAGRHLLVEVAPFHPFIYLSAALTLALVALCACMIPAVRAARLNPATAQRG